MLIKVLKNNNWDTIVNVPKDDETTARLWAYIAVYAPSIGEGHAAIDPSKPVDPKQVQKHTAIARLKPTITIDVWGEITYNK